jgi:hypothetical protein
MDKLRELDLWEVPMLQEGEKQEIKNIDKNIELLKIQICSERAHVRLTYLISTTFAIFLGFAVLFYTLFYENVLPLVGISVGIIILLVGTVYEIYRIRKRYQKELKKISDMIEMVKEGKLLPRLDELLEEV